MSKKISFFTLIFAPLLSFGQMQIDSFDSAPADSNYWGYEISENADSTLSYVNVSYITDQVAEGTGAMQLEYSGHNSESWGGYAKIQHMARHADDGGPGGDGPMIGGEWKLAPVEGALKVGPSPDDGSWWQNSADDVTTRACLFDDVYHFGPDGSFQNILGDQTWLEAWQEGVDADGCGAPVAPHDGSANATYFVDDEANTITLNGVGAYMGIAKAITDGELAAGSEVPASRTYTIHPTEDGHLKLSISTGGGYWTFLFVHIPPAMELAGTWKLAPVEGAFKVGPNPDDGSWWQNSVADLTTRACLFDDEYVFNADGSFQNVLGADTWLETWQGVTAEACGAPVAPHDGSAAATYSHDASANTLTITGLGAYLGIAKAITGGELSVEGTAVPESRTFDVHPTDDGSLKLSISTGGGYWTFTFVKEPEGFQLAGSWKLAPIEGAMKVGPNQDDGSWWQNSAGDVTTRACLFDDEYVFNADGSFQNVLGADTWLETWQGVTAEACGAPVAPHDGSAAATYSHDASANTLTITGLGAYLGIAKAITGGELSVEGTAVPESRTFDVHPTDDGSLKLSISTGGGYWTFTFVKETPSQQFVDVDTDPYTPDAVFTMRPDHGEVWDWSGYDSVSFKYYNSVPASEANRIHLRLNISDYAGVDADYTGLGEYYYSFHYILDSEPGWNTVTMPLVRNDDWNGGGLNLTGWAGDADNYEFDAHAVGGFHLEFSIGGGGEGDHVGGTVILDDFKLVGYKGVDLVIFNGMGTPPGWGNPFTWGGSQMFVTEGGGYIPGTNALTYVQQDAWTGGGFNIAPPVDLHSGNEWLSDSISFWMHSEADAPQLRLQFESGDNGKVGGNFTPVAAGGWNHYKYALKDFAYVDNTSDFDTSAITVFQILSEGNGAAGRTFHFDNMWTGTPDIDVVAPVAPENVSGIPGANFNLVTWTDIDGEEGEMYDVFASMNPITEIGVPGVEPIASNVIEGAQTATHYLVAPLEDMNVTYYYAVVCVDAAGNVGAPGVTSSPVTNEAKGIPTISLDVPSNFVADGDLSEWTNSGIMPFIINPSTGGVWASVDDEADLNGTVYLAIDDDYIYFAADVIDDDYHFGEGNWWDQDALQLFMGLYDSRGPKHNSIKRGDEPDYIFYANENTLQLDNPGNVSIGNSDEEHYHFEMFDPDYVVEGKISLDTLAVLSGDPRFHPVNGMKIPLDIYFHDNDNGTWEGNIGYSTLATDQQWNNPQEWSFTWIGDQATILSNDNEAPIAPEVFALYQNYPNPFNPVTNIKFSLPENQKVSLGIYSVTGRLVETLVNENRVAGFHTIQWNAGRHASGVYFYRLDAGVNSKTQKMILLK